MEYNSEDEECPICHKQLQWEEKESSGSVEFYTIGSYCKNCNRWILTTSVSKLERDNTIYNIVLLEKENLNRKQLNLIKKASNKSVEEVKELLENITPILFQGKAKEIKRKIELLNEIKINYEIIPPFPFDDISIENTIDTIMKLIDENNNISLDKRQYRLILKKDSYLNIEQVKEILKYSNEEFQDNIPFSEQKERTIFQGNALDVLTNAYWLDRNEIPYEISPIFPYKALLDHGKEIAKKNQKLEQALEGKLYNWKKLYDNSKILAKKSLF